MTKNVKENPIRKNQYYEVEVTNLGYNGEGIGRINGFTVFVEGALVGEIVKVKIVKVNKRFAFGKMIEIIKYSKDRVNPNCEIYNKCGGCQLQHLSYEAQLRFKRERVEDCLIKIGDFEKGEIKVNETIGMKEPSRYRNKVQLPVGKFDDDILIGFYASRSHNIIDMDHCLIQDEVGDLVVKITKEWMKKFNIEPYDENTGKGIVRHIMLRKGFKTGEAMIVIVTNGTSLPHKNEFIDMMVKNIPGIKSIFQNINCKNTNVVLGKRCINIWGNDTIVDYIGEFKFNISPLSFFQVNPVQTEVLYNKVLEYSSLTGRETVFDAYCGTGTISLFVSQNAKMVYGIEIVSEAIENARLNALENDIENVEFIVGQSEKEIPRLIKKGIKAEVVVVDPPRKGCERELLESIVKMKPERIVYVSCNPSTLARDLRILADFDYKIKEVQPVDMFPQTSNIETVVKITYNF